jgi:Zn ribbon nucleic-acid-binding protein
MFNRIPRAWEQQGVSENDVETFAFHNYWIRGSKRSKFADGVEHEVTAGFGCPRCKTANMIALDHGDHRECKHCGLQVQLFGNGLHVWDRPRKLLTGWTVVEVE